MTLAEFSRYALGAGVAATVLIGGAVALQLSGPESGPVTVDRGDGASFIKHFDTPHDDTTWRKITNIYRTANQRTAWSAEHVMFRDDHMALKLTRDRVQYHPYTGGEYQKRGFYHHGRYEVIMQAPSGNGQASGFFTHTNSTFGDPHDEIDIEFLGNRPRQMQANYFSNGVQHGSVYIDLPFDTTEAPHLYAFEWEEDEIRWYVEGEHVYTATPDDHPFPQVPGRVILHLWSGSPAQYGWHGEPTWEDGIEAKVYCASFRKLGDTDAPQCSDSWPRE